MNFWGWVAHGMLRDLFLDRPGPQPAPRPEQPRWLAIEPRDWLSRAPGASPNQQVQLDIRAQNVNSHRHFSPHPTTSPAPVRGPAPSPAQPGAARRGADHNDQPPANRGEVNKWQKKRRKKGKRGIRRKVTLVSHICQTRLHSYTPTRDREGERRKRERERKKKRERERERESERERERERAIRRPVLACPSHPVPFEARLYRRCGGS